MKGVVYDCEIIRMIPSQWEELQERYDYCEGWDDFENMGVSVVCAADLHSDEFWVFSDNPWLGVSPLAEIEVLFNSSKLYGFNSSSFDDLLLAANGVRAVTSFDLLLECRLSAYGSYSWKDQPPGHSYKLQSIAEANGLSKTGTGELAPKLWQDGNYQAVVDYCLNDVLITKKLINLFFGGELVNPNTGLFFRSLALE